MSAGEAHAKRYPFVSCTDTVLADRDVFGVNILDFPLMGAFFLSHVR